MHKPAEITVNGITDNGRGWAKRLSLGCNYINKYLREHSMRETEKLISDILSGKISVKPAETRTVTINGETKTLSEWARILNLPPNTLKNFYRNHGEELTTRKIYNLLHDIPSSLSRKNESLVLRGVEMQPCEWSLFLGKSRSYYSAMKNMYGKEGAVKRMEKLIDKLPEDKKKELFSR